MTGPGERGSEDRDREGQSVPPRARLDRYATEVDERLIFDPDSEWFSDVPLVTVAPDRSWTITRGQLTDSEAAAVTAAVNGWVAAYVAEGPHLVGVFTDLFARTSINAPGASFWNDPRDIAEIDLRDLITGRPQLAELRRRVAELARTLKQAEAYGLVAFSFAESTVALTNAPDRVD